MSLCKVMCDANCWNGTYAHMFEMLVQCRNFAGIMSICYRRKSNQIFDGALKKVCFVTTTYTSLNNSWIPSFKREMRI